MKTTKYFDYISKRIDRKEIKIEWIISTLKNPDFKKIQSDGRIRKWKWIKERKKYLRVIILEDQQTIHNAFFDRRFKLNN